MSEGLKFELKVVNRSANQLAESDAAKRRADRENGRVQAQQFAAEALLSAVNIMRTSKDPTQVLKAAKMVMDRAWGIPKSAEDEEQSAKNQSVIELLASMSMEITSTKPERQAIERDVTPNAALDLGQFLPGEGQDG